MGGFMSSKKSIVYVVGEETKTWEFENGVVFFYEEPTTQQIVSYKDGIHYRRRGKEFVARSTERQIILADEILRDVGGLGFKALEGEIKVLDKNTKPAEIAHLKIEGVSPKSWKDLIPAIMKTQFIEGLLGGIEEQAKNE